MAKRSSRKDQLWYFAQNLVEEETKFIHIAQQDDEHGTRIQQKYNQLVSNLSCLGDIIAMMYQEEKLSMKELEHIQSLQSTPIRANEELLSIIARKPSDVYECFLLLVKSTNQLHLYQMLVSGDDTCDDVNRESAPEHKDLISRNFMWLSENLDTESGLITQLYQQNVLTVREKERIFCVSDIFVKNELLLGLLSKKSPTEFETFLDALDDLGQCHLTEKLRKPSDSTADRSKLSHAVQAPTNRPTFKDLLPKAFRKSEQKPDILHSSSKLVIPPKKLPKPRQKLIPTRSSSKPVPPPKPDTRSTVVQHGFKAIGVVSQNTQKKVQYRRSKGVTLQSRLKDLDPYLKTELAIKVTSVSLMYMDKPAGGLKMSSQILLQEFYRMKKETDARNVETNVELEQLRENVSQFSAVTSVNEVFRKQLHSMEQTLINERFQSSKDRMQLEDKMEKLKADIYNEKAKCRRLEEEQHSNKSVILKMEERLRKSECDNQFYQHQIQELDARLATRECELEMFRDNFQESNSEMMLLRTERDKLNGVCEMLTKEKAIRNELEIQLNQAQEHCSDLLERLKENEKSLQLAEKEKLDLFSTHNKKMEERSLESDFIAKLEEDLKIVKCQRKELEDKLSDATAQLEQLECKAECINITSATRESHVIRTNHQFLVENLRSSRLIDLLHTKNCITDEERDFLSNQPNNFCINDALLHWMRNIKFTEDKGLKVLECLRQSEQNFVLDILSKGGVLIKSKISTKRLKERPPFNLFPKTPKENVSALKEKADMLIEELNQRHWVPLHLSQNATSDTADDEITIAPYCHQEDNGIVFWFWCQSKNAQRNLQSIYSSDELLEKVESILKQFSNVNATSESQLLVPTDITIYMDDFRKNEKVIDFKTEPKLYLAIKRISAQKNYAGFDALAVLADEVFAIIKKNSEVEVYNRTSLQFQRRFTVDNLEEPRDIVSCSINNCLYIIDGKPRGQPMEILRVDINGNILKKIWRGEDWGRLSVTDESNLILAVLDKSKVLEITPDGQLVREITLAMENPRHAVKLGRDRFVVTFDRCPGGGICIVNSKGKVVTSSSHKVLDSAVFLPLNVAVNKDGSFLLADADGGRILLLTPTLKYLREFISKKQTVSMKPGLVRPRTLFVDELNGRLLVCDNKLSGGRILVYDIAG